MKVISLSVCLCLLIINYVCGQNISTFAGNGGSGYSGDGGLATEASIGFAGTITFDKNGNCYFSELNNTIRKISSSGIISTIAGNGISGFSGDNGPATAAEFNFTGGGGLACDYIGNLYVADQANNRIRKIDVTTGIVSTIAGSGVAGFGGDGGLADSAQLNSPGWLTFDTIDNLYFTDAFNYRIRGISNSGIITTIAGTGIAGSTGDSGLATSAEVYAADGIFCKNGNVYLSDGQSIRVINLLSGYIYPFAGTGTPGFSGDGGPAVLSEFGLAIDVTSDDSSNVYLSDEAENRIRKIDNIGIITTVAGNGISGYSGDGDFADSAELSSPRGIAIDPCNNLYIVDNGNKRIRKVLFNPYCWSLKVPQVVANEVTIYPNPTTEILHIDNVTTESSYAILNITGIIEQQGILHQGNNQITVQSLPPGIYLLEMVDDEGNKTVKKIAKQ